MIYIAVIKSSMYESGGMVRSKFASLFYHERFDTIEDAGEYVLNNYSGPKGLFEAPYGNYKRIVQLCLNNKHIIYTWDLSSIQDDEVRHIARHIVPKDWKYLIDKNPKHFDTCIEKVGHMPAEAISDNFLINHANKVRISDIKDPSYKGLPTTYEWIRKQRPEAFKQIEGAMIKPLEILPTKDDVLREVVGHVKAKGADMTKPTFNIYGLLGSPEVVATKSKFYKRIEFSKLLDFTKQAYVKLNKDNASAFANSHYFKQNIGLG